MIVKDEQRQAERFKLFTKDIKWALRNQKTFKKFHTHFESLVIIKCLCSPIPPTLKNLNHDFPATISTLSEFQSPKVFNSCSIMKIRMI